MAALNTDLFKKLARRWVGQIGAGGVADATVTTIPLSSATNLPTDTAVVAVIDRVDVNGTATASLEESIIGVVSGSNLVTCTRGVEGTAQAHSAGAVVEILVTAKGWNDMVDGILVQHNQLGLHTNITACNVTASGIVTANTVAEKTAASGVTIDGLLVKDSQVQIPGGPWTTATDGATVTFDLAVSRNQIVTLGGNRTLALSNPATGMVFLLTLKQDATGSRTVTWFSGITWAGGSAPTLTTTASKADTFGLICFGTNTYYGYVVGQNI